MAQQTKSETALVSLAAIRRPKRGVTEYLFFERQQIFSLQATRGRRAEAATVLRRALREKVPVKVVLDPRRGRIQRVDTPTSDEVRTFRRGRVPPDVRGTTRTIDLARIDPTTFNVVDLRLKVPIFRLCTRTIPNYTKAKEIFDFCARQACYLGGPFDISPCIPFQYVIDGCYARAHKMRQIITTRYRYCCEKVFSFANQDNDTLAVKADKGGG